MKELILFSFVVLFISCQNSPVSKFEATTQTTKLVQTFTPFAEALACDSSTVEPIDLVKELENQQNPGIHYREVVLRSEIPEDVSKSQLVCISQVSSTTEDSEPSPSLTLPMADSESDENSWKSISEQWDIQKKLSCGTQNLQNLNPVCQNRKMLALN